MYVITFSRTIAKLKNYRRFTFRLRPFQLIVYLWGYTLWIDRCD